MFNNYDIDTTNDEEGSGSWRGAKGSVRDRLISILLRKGYEKFRLQKEFYTKDNLSKKIEYIKSLKDFDINKLGQLDEEDKKVINNMTFIVPVIPLTEKKVDLIIPGIDNSMEPLDKKMEDLHATSEVISNYEPTYELDGREIEFDPSKEVFDFNKYDYYEIENVKRGLDIKGLSETDKEIVDLDNEKKLTEDEKVIVEEIEKFIDKSLILLDEIKDDVAIIEEEVEKPYTIEQVEVLEENQ